MKKLVRHLLALNLFIFLNIFCFKSQVVAAAPFDYPKLNELKKITLGPDDQLEESYFAKNHWLLFTKKANLVSHLNIQDLNTGTLKELTSNDADSYQGKFNADGKVVFVSFKYHSKGDICFTPNIPNLSALPLKQTEIECVERNSQKKETERSQPFWFNTNEIGFTEKSGPQEQQLVRYQIQNRILTILTSEPEILAPSAHYNGSYIVYNQITNNHSQMVLWDYKINKKYLIPLSLPGSTGVAAIDEEANYLYFTQYMGDSNNDSLIDGNDNSVVWRVSLSPILSTKNPPLTELPLEQLTPMDYNCSFPNPTKEMLYLTCAFEGSLDIYSLPLEGFVPKKWSLKTIESAVQTSRSYQDRILLINTLKSRSENSKEIELMNKRLFFLHLQAEEFSAANNYVTSFSKAERELWEIFIKGRRLKKISKLSKKSFIIKNAIEMEISQINKINLKENSKEQTLKDLILLHLKAYQGTLNQNSSALFNIENKINLKSPPVYYWLLYQLYEDLYPKDLSTIIKWNTLYSKMLQENSLSLESKLFYTNEYFLHLENILLNTTNDSILQRIKFLSQFLNSHKLLPEQTDLFHAEISSLELILKTTPSDKLQNLKKIDQLLLKYKNLSRQSNVSINEINNYYFIRKTINTRTILNFLNAQQLREMGIMSSNWLRDTQSSHTEYAYARDVVIAAAREQAYGYWSQKNPRLASDYFFQSLSLTDDLESYSGYVETMKDIGQSKAMEERLLYLQRHEVMRDGVPFVKALLAFEEAKNNSAPNKYFDQALDELKNLRSDLVDPMPLLLTGFIYLEKFLLTKKGLEMDRDLWQKSHNSLILAYDLSQGQRRIRAAALTQLALLHLWGQSYGPSVHFWELRKKLGFDVPNMNLDRQAFTWYYSQSLFLNSEPIKAANEILSLPSEFLSPEFFERVALYFSMGGNYTESQKYYDKITSLYGKNFESLTEPSKSKIRLGCAYNLFKLNKRAEAKSLFQLLLNNNSRSQISKEAEDSVLSDPKLTETLILGFLVQLESDSQLKIQYLQKRLSLLKEDLPSLIQTKIQLIEELSLIQPHKAQELVLESLQDLTQFEKDNGPLGQTIFYTLKNYMAHVLLFPALYQKESHQNLKTLIQKSLYSLRDQEPQSPPSILIEQWKLEYLWNLFQERILNTQAHKEWRTVLNQSSLVKKIQEQDSKLFQEQEAVLNSF